jgi:hypothetical protein
MDGFGWPRILLSRCGYSFVCLRRLCVLLKVRDLLHMHALLIVEIEMFDKKVPTRQWSKYQCVGVVTALYGDKKADIYCAGRTS